MEDKILLKRGDDVRVKFATQDGFIEHAATVLFSTDKELVVIFASGMRYRVPHGEGRYQRVCNA